MRKIFTLIALAITLNSCTTREWNAGIHDADVERDYIFQNRLPTNNAQDTFVVLVFSGGGTRSAAFAYGVLEKLRNTPITINGKSRRLLDEVDVISSVSGGSYTAAYYGLFGEQGVGLTPDHVNRIFRDMEGEGLIRRQKKRLSILNVESLVEIGHFDPGMVLPKHLI